MASTRPSFANYPVAQEAADVAYRYEEDKNPVLRGLPMVVASALVTSSDYVSKYLWKNAGFDVKAEGLEGVPWTLNPIVIPLADTASSTPAPSLLEFTPDLTTPQPASLPGRFHSAADFTTRYTSGALTPLQVVDALLPLIRRDATPRPSQYSTAFVAHDVERIRAAARASTQRYAEGKPLGPLDGVPIGVKCDIDVEGYVSTVGMRSDGGKRWPFFAEVAPESAWPVRKLEEAGAVVVGHQHMHEVGMDTSGCSPAMGTPKNWYNTSYYPGGSSTGAGSSMGAGLVPISIGTDAGGSIRIPATFNGLYGLKPTFNRTQTKPSTVVVVGPLAATAADLTLAYRLMAQPDPTDPVQGQFALSRPPSSKKKTIGVCWEWVEKADPVVLQHFKQAITYFESALGYAVVPIHLPLLREGQVAHAATCLVESYAKARERTPNPEDWAMLLNHPNRLLLALGRHTPADAYLRYGQIRTVLMRHLAHLWREHGADMLVLTPTSPARGWRAHAGDQAYGFSDGNMTVRNMLYVWLANFAGCPAASAPMGYVDGEGEGEVGEGKVPVGIMAMGDWGAEEGLLGWAREVEGYLGEGYEGGRRRPGEWVDVVALAEGRGKGDEGGDGVDGGDGK